MCWACKIMEGKQVWSDGAILIFQKEQIIASPCKFPIKLSHLFS